jgi:phage-related protein
VTTSVGQINFGATADASRMSTELKAAVATAAAAAQQQLNRNPLNVKIEIDTSAAITKAKRELRRADLTARAGLDIDTSTALAVAQGQLNAASLTATANLDIDTSAALIQAETALGQLDGRTVDVGINVNITPDQLRNLRQAASAIRRLESKTVTVGFAINLSPEQLRNLRGAASAIRRLESKSVVIDIRINVDEAQLRRVAELIRDIRNRNVEVRVDTDSANRGVLTLDSNLGRLVKWTSIGAAIAAGIAAIGGAAGAAVGAVGGLVVGLLAIAPALGAIGAAAAVGLSGIGDAFTSMKAMTESAAQDAQTQSDAIASAQNSLTGALEQAESAQISLNDAQEAAADAAADVADAYKTAQERLDGYQQSLHEANLDEREAVLNLQDAQKALAKADPSDRARALLRVERAQIALSKAQKASQDLGEEAREAQEKGIDQADEVVAARKRQAEADKAVVAAERGVAAAARQVAQATDALAKAQNTASPAVTKFQQAMAKLAPSAQEFVLAAKALGPAWAEVRKSVQESLFDDLGAELTETANATLPLLKDGLGGIAEELNGAATNALQFLRSAEGMELLNATFANAKNLMAGMRQGTGELTAGFTDLLVTAGPHMEQLGRSIAAIGEGIGRAFTRAAESGALDQLFVGLNQALSGLGPLLDGLLTAFIEIGGQVLPTLLPFFETLGQVLKDIAPSLGELGAVFVNSLTAILPSLGQLITALADGLQPIMPVLVQLIKAMSDALTPLIPVFADIAVTIGQALIGAIQAIAPALPPLAKAFSDILTAVAPLIPLFAESLSTVLIALAPAISEIALALTPVIQMFAEEMTPVIKELAPVLAEVGKIIGLALADAIKQLAPLLPDIVRSFSNLLLAIIPIMPELVRLAADLLPPLIQIIGDLIPPMLKVIDAFTWLVQNVIIPYVIPAIKELAQVWTDSFQDVADAINWVTDTVFPKIGEGLTWVKDQFNSAVDAIGKKWAELKEDAREPINYVIDTVFNKGLFKAWGAIDNLLGGVLPDATPIPMVPAPAMATGGSVGMRGGSGNGTKDDILTWLSNGEHVVTAAEVMAAGGQNVLYAIRDMIARGIPFTWDNGKVVQDLGRDNLNAYGAAVKTKGIGNVPPEGLFDTLLPRFATGGAILPWMLQLQKGHEFARAQHGRPYQWAGPRFMGDSFDCSGFMGSIAAAILGDNPWQRYWATSSFGRGQRASGPQGFVAGLDSGFAIGVTDDPGGPGGGHTAGTLGAIPELGIHTPVNVESGGSLGDVHYGGGTDPRSFFTQYHLPIGANGFFEPGVGGGSTGPSVEEQSSFLRDTISKIVHAVTDPLRSGIDAAVGLPPPELRRVPGAALTATEKAVIDFASAQVGNLGGLIGGAWQKAQDLGGSLLDSLNPFDSGGIANGTGFMPKNVLEPERVLSPEQTRLFEALVAALQSISSGTGAATTSIVDAIGNSVGTVVGDAISALVPDPKKTPSDPTASIDTTFLEKQNQEQFDQTGQLISETQALALRTESSTEKVLVAEFEMLQAQITEVANKLTAGVLGPVVQSAMSQALGIVEDAIGASTEEITAAQQDTTTAVNNIDVSGDSGTPAFGAPGSAFDFAAELSNAVVAVSQVAQDALIQVGVEIANAALEQRPSRAAGRSRGLLGSEEFSGGPLVDMIIRLTGVEIEVRDLIESLAEDMRAFRGEEFQAFDENGQLISDTASLVERTASSMELVIAEQNRINRALIASVLRYLMVNVVIPVLTAILTALITLAVTAIGAAIGFLIGGPIGAAVGAAIGAAIGVVLGAAAGALIATVGLGAAAAIDSFQGGEFDEGGVAQGTGFMPKNTIAPERVLSPRQTSSFEKLVQVLDRGTATTSRTVQIASMNIHGREPAAKTNDTLLRLLNT